MYHADKIIFSGYLISLPYAAAANTEFCKCMSHAAVDAQLFIIGGTQNNGVRRRGVAEQNYRIGNAGNRSISALLPICDAC